MKIDEQTVPRRFAAVRRLGRKIVVVADDGASVALVLLDPGQPSDTGARFDHRGRTWEVRGVRADSGVLVAEPVAAGTDPRRDH